MLIAFLAILTGGLHLDGVADTFDGLFLWGGAERRLAVMRDPHIGSHGVSAIALVLLGKYAVLSDLNGPDRAMALLGAVTVSRTLILVSAGMACYARPQGTGRLMIEATTRRDALMSTLAVFALSGAVAGWTGLIASLGALSLAFTLTRLAAKRLGGITGDILGATVELGELTYLVMFAAFRAL
ncbi:adenosylcobinamide-GDP ribazoletransferase [Singulisphaera sp. Ch08]|uniref:Adenosylcobinamide-GDP ribazoletransferase n=1 Tax=Singulisphaera sp. Ch08 TaxID=3120278 RepID=A0AAU7CH74_9BACT